MASGPVVIFELDLGGWQQLGALEEMETCGSISSHEPGGRQVILFGWIDGVPGVWRADGFDVANDAIREIHAFSPLERLADLAAGPYEREVRTKAGPARARWRLVREEPA
jgi:hypothetical protein